MQIRGKEIQLQKEIEREKQEKEIQIREKYETFSYRKKLKRES